MPIVFLLEFAIIKARKESKSVKQHRQMPQVSAPANAGGQGGNKSFETLANFQNWKGVIPVKVYLRPDHGEPGHHAAERQ